MPAGKQKYSGNRAKRLAFDGMFVALAVVLMLFGSIIPIATFTAPMLAGLCLLPLSMEFGPKAALPAYAAVGILSFFLVADREMVLFFIFLFGYYPILQPYLAKINLPPIRYLVKLTLFNFSLALVYTILLFLLTNPLLLQEFSGSPAWFWVALLLLGNLAFFAYDLLIDKLKIVYIQKVRKRFFH